MKALPLALACCAALAAAGGALAAPKAQRPTFIEPARTLETAHVSVHYTKDGPKAPPAKDANGDGVPDYVAQAAAAANEAWLFYGRSGFRAPRPDRGGGNPKVDIYVDDLPRGLDGVTVPAAYTTQGAFTVISNRLTAARRAARGSLQQTVAHELFHVFQLSYVPSGALPGWAIEGSATAMETSVYPRIADPVRARYVRQWLREPWRSLFDERGGCDHCYGGALWWRFLARLGGRILPAYFARLEGFAPGAESTGDGTRPLDEVISRQTNGRESLFSAFSRFSYDIYRDGAGPAAYARLSASTTRQSTPARVVRGLSTHYIPITVPADARGIGVSVAATGGPAPDVKLIVGGPQGRSVERTLRSADREQRFRTRFASRAEARDVMLIVTSGRREGASYTVSYQAR